MAVVTEGPLGPGRGTPTTHRLAVLITILNSNVAPFSPVKSILNDDQLHASIDFAGVSTNNLSLLKQLLFVRYRDCGGRLRVSGAHLPLSTGTSTIIHVGDECLFSARIYDYRGTVAVQL